MKHKILIFFLAIIFFWGGVPSSFADDEGGRTIDFKKSSVLDNEYSEPFRDNDWFFTPRQEDSVQEIRTLFYEDILPKFKYLFLFVGLIFWVIYITYMISSVGNEEKISEQRKNLITSIVGFVVVSLAIEIGRVLTPLGNGSEIVDIAGSQGVVQKVIAFLQIAVGIVALFMIFYSAVRFIKANGDEEESGQAKKHLKWGLLGMIFVILSEPLVNKVFYPEDKSYDQGEISKFAQEASGFLQFALTFLAVFAFAALIVAGFYLVASFGDEERQGKAKTIIWSTLLGLLVIALSFVLVTALVPNA